MGVLRNRKVPLQMTEALDTIFGTSSTHQYQRTSKVSLKKWEEIGNSQLIYFSKYLITFSRALATVSILFGRGCSIAIVVRSGLDSAKTQLIGTIIISLRRGTGQ
jgi:hypothetical protein